jgi:HSP20 family protein
MRAAHLKAVSSDKGGIPVKTEEYAPEGRGSWLETTRIPNFLGDMERMMSEFISRPFGGYGAPWRGLFSEFGAPGAYSPAVDIYEDGGCICLKADLPGFSKKDIYVKLVGNTIEITGEKRTEEKIDKRDYLRLERSYGKFNRTVRLPEGLDCDHVTANFADGVLEIKIPRVEDKRAIHHVQIK